MYEYKKFLKHFGSIILLSIGVTTQAYVDGVTITGTKTVTLSANNGFKSEKKATLNTIEISEERKKIIRAELEKTVFQPNSPYISPSEFNIDLGMNGVPVLDQGPYSTCATFVVTAFLNALEYKADFISQQCLLEVGAYLNRFNSEYSGWESTKIINVFKRIEKYGVVDKFKCPREYPNKTEMMNPQVYASLSQPLPKKLTMEYFSNTNLAAIKKALNSKKRVIVNIITHDAYTTGLPINFSKNGLWGFPNQTWERNVIINDLFNDNTKLGSHFVIITGFSDAKNYFKIRNSWGTSFGEYGEFYMSYDYFRIMGTIAIVLQDDDGDKTSTSRIGFAA